MARPCTCYITSAGLPLRVVTRGRGGCADKGPDVLTGLYIFAIQLTCGGMYNTYIFHLCNMV